MRRITLDEASGKLLNFNIKVIGEWSKATAPTELECLVCGNKWTAKPSRVMNGACGCPQCAWRKLSEDRITKLDDVIDELNNRNIAVIGKWRGNNKRCRFRCLICGNEWETIPYSILNAGTGCKKCAGRRLSSPLSVVKERLNEVDIELVDEESYKNVGQEKTKLRCKKCGHVWSQRISNIINTGDSCPNCAHISKGEDAIIKWMDANGVQYETQKTFSDCRYKLPLRFDFYIPSCNLCIEYDGKQHFEPVERWGGSNGFNERRIRDNIKDEYCKEKKLNLFRIPYWDFDNLPSILSSLFHFPNAEVV